MDVVTTACHCTTAPETTQRHSAGSATVPRRRLDQTAHRSLLSSRLTAPSTKDTLL